MQNKHILRDRCILLVLLLIFSIGTYSLFGNIKNINFSELANYQHRVKGLVTDSNGIPIPGVNVGIKGTSYGTFTNKEGYFYVDAAPTDVLILSYIGFKPLEVIVGSSDELSLVLEEDVTDLEAVTVNAGYYTVKERERTGSISKVTAEEIELLPVINPLQALEGRVAGIEVTQRSGVPGTAPTVRIRGQNSLRSSRSDNGNLPLYIIDGVPVNSSPITGINSLNNNTGIDPLNTLNLSNIKRIEILKDADATAIYGSRGANGIILITTKKGPGFNKKTEIEARLYSGLGKASYMMKLLDTKQYLKMRNQAFENDNAEPIEGKDYDLLLWNQNRYTDWQKELLGGTAIITDLNVSATGGNATTSFRLGGSYHKEGTVFPGDFDYNKITVGLNLNHVSENKKFEVNLSVNYGLDNNDLFNDSSFISDALTLPPNAPELYNKDGSLNWENSTWDNPLASLSNTSNGKVDNIIANLGVSYHILEDLTFRVNLGYTSLSSKQKTFISKNSYDPQFRKSVTNRSNSSFTNRKSWIIEPQLIYNLKIRKGTIDALIGTTLQQSDNSRLYIAGTGYVTESLIGNLDAAEDVTVDENSEIRYKYTAIFARIGYNWAQKYFINLTGRRDGSSRFGPDKRFANFGAIGGAWIFSEESFIKENLSFLSFGKLRGSYGITGSDQIGDYKYLDAYESTAGPGGLYPTQLTNPDYSWESNKKLEAAIELGFIKDQVNIGISWYRNRSSNQLVGYPLPEITGFSSIQANLPATVQNTGWEFELSTLNIKMKNFRWQTFLNLTFPENELISFPNIDQTSYNNTYRVGHPLSIFLLYQYNGINPETGLYDIEDVNEDGRWDYIDRTAIKDTGRKFFGGFTNNLAYKSFALSFLWQFVKQNGPSTSFVSPGFMSNQPNKVLNSWQNSGDDTDVQKLSQSIEPYRAYALARRSEYLIRDASFLRLKTLSLSYNLPPEVLQNLGLKACKLLLSAQNLITITDYKGLNPEFTGGITMPVLRTITCGAQINF